MHRTSYQSKGFPLRLIACISMSTELKVLIVKECYLLAVILGNTSWLLFPFLLLFTHFLCMHVLIMLRVLGGGFWAACHIFPLVQCPVDLLGCICRHISQGDRCGYSTACAEMRQAWKEHASVFRGPAKSMGSFSRQGFSVLEWHQSLLP